MIFITGVFYGHHGIAVHYTWRYVMKVYQGYGSGSPVYTINSDRIYQGYG